MMHTQRAPGNLERRHAALPNLPPSPPPPSRANLKAWWNQFNFVQRAKKAKEQGPVPYGRDDGAVHPVFGVPLRESLNYASAQIQTAGADGEMYVWGDIPVVVAKCGLYLKENATEIEGTFRVSGSTKRMRELQQIFETPPKYGKKLDWSQESFTPHDVASVFRRYLTQMPEPVIPHNLYSKFREALQDGRSQDEIIKTYKQLIRSMPRQNQYLLLYVLDLLSVFARKSDKNLMTATNLAVIFRPGLISHPNHELSPKEHQLSQQVLEFLIEHQDWFMLDVPPPPSRQGSSAPSPLSPGPMYQSYPPTNEDSTRHGSNQRRGSGDRRNEAWPLGRAGDPLTEVSGDAITIASATPSEPGWKLIERGRKTSRRRSSSASASADPALPSNAGHGHVRIAGSSSGALPENTQNVGTYAALGAVTVSRSRTLPSRRTASRDHSSAQGHESSENEKHSHSERESRKGEREGKPNVLKKQKRASVQPQRSAPIVPQLSTSTQNASGSSSGPTS